jgi:hypothetical protein
MTACCWSSSHDARGVPEGWMFACLICVIASFATAFRGFHESFDATLVQNIVCILVLSSGGDAVLWWFHCRSFLHLCTQLCVWCFSSKEFLFSGCFSIMCNVCSFFLHNRWVCYDLISHWTCLDLSATKLCDWKEVGELWVKVFIIGNEYVTIITDFIWGDVGGTESWC